MKITDRRCTGIDYYEFESFFYFDLQLEGVEKIAPNSILQVTLNNDIEQKRDRRVRITKIVTQEGEVIGKHELEELNSNSQLTLFLYDELVNECDDGEGCDDDDDD